VCKGECTVLYVEGNSNGNGAYTDPEELELEEEDKFVSRYDLYDGDGKRIPRCPGSTYAKHCVLFIVDFGDDANDGDDAGLIPDVIRKKVVELGEWFANRHQQKAKVWQNSRNVTVFFDVENEKMKTLVDVIGYHSTVDAVARMYSSYLEDGTFSDIAEHVVALYFKDGDVSKVTKEIQFNHRLIKAEE